MGRTGVFVGLAFLLGVLSLAGFRMALAAPEPPVHYHANFAIFAGGERIDLTDDRYMEDVAACAHDMRNPPAPSRVHLHNNDQDVVHVHDGGATWGHLLANLRMVLGDRVLVTRDGDVFLHGEGGTLKFVLNGRPELSVYNETIRPGDRLLISFGPESMQEVIATQFPVVASNAPEFDGMPDPAGCGGHEHRGLGARLRHAFAG
jgi:hypothetical protein